MTVIQTKISLIVVRQEEETKLRWSFNFIVLEGGYALFLKNRTMKYTAHKNINTAPPLDKQGMQVPFS